MLRPALVAVADRLPEPRIFWDRRGTSPYLSRYYLAGREKTVTDVLDGLDGVERQVLLPLERHGLYLHKFHRSDDNNELHSHPWDWAVSLILAGGYEEERRIGDRVVRRTLRPGMLNLIRARDFHRVDLLDEDCWSLIVTGPKRKDEWSFWNRDTGQETPWEEFIRGVRAQAVNGGVPLAARMGA